MSEADRVAERWNLTLGKLGRSDNRRLVQEPGEGYINQPYYVARDGRIIKQFSSASDRAEWLDEYEIDHEYRDHPEPKPMSLP